MSAAYKPEGHTSVSPYLTVDGAAGTIAFLIQVLGAEELMRIPSEDGRIMHAEVRIDDTVVMLSDGAEGWPPQPGHVHVYVPDVDAVYSRALAAGADSVQEPCRRATPTGAEASRTPAVRPGGLRPGWSSRL